MLIGRLNRLAAVLQSKNVTMTTLADGTGVVVDLAGMKLLTVNSTGMLIVRELCNGNDSLHRVAEAIATEFDVDETVAALNAVTFLEELENALRLHSPAVSPTREVKGL